MPPSIKRLLHTIGEVAPDPGEAPRLARVALGYTEPLFDLHCEILLILLREAFHMLKCSFQTPDNGQIL